PQRLPAQEIESLVDKTIRQSLDDPQKLSEILTLENDADHETLQVIAQFIAQTETDKIIKTITKRIIVNADELNIHLDPVALASFLHARYGIRVQSRVDTH